MNNEIRSLAFFGVRYLPGEYRLEFFRRHVRSRENPFPLCFQRRGDDDNSIDILVSAGLE